MKEKELVFHPTRHMTLKRRHLDVVMTSILRDNVQTTSLKRHAGRRGGIYFQKIIIAHNVYLYIALSDTDSTDRGSFNGKQLDLMSQIRDLRSQMARKQQAQLSFG